MFIDSHCHINFEGLIERLDQLLDNMRLNSVTHALCVSVDLESLPSVLAVAERYPNIYASVGVHPDHENCAEPSVAQLIELSRHPKVVAIGEIGVITVIGETTVIGEIGWIGEIGGNGEIPTSPPRAVEIDQ